MRLWLYRTLLQLPFRIFGALVGVGGIIASLLPERIKALIGGSEMHIQELGIACLIVALVYVLLLWILKPGPPSVLPGGMVVSGPNTTIHVHNYPDQIQSELAAINPGSIEGGSTPSIVVAQPDGAPPQSALRSVVGQVGVAEESDTASFTGQVYPPTVRAISPLFVGQVIISASQLADGDARNCRAGVQWE